VLIQAAHLSTVYHQDYLKTLGSIPDGTVKLVITDPPYGIGYQNNLTSQPHTVLQGDDEAFSYATLANAAHRVLGDDGVFLAWTGWSTYPQHVQQVEAAGFRIREPLIIQKRASGKTGLYVDFQSNSDWIIYATKGKPRFKKTQLLRNKRAGTIPNKGRKPVPEWKTRFPSCWFGPEFPYSTANPVTQKQWRHPTPKNPECAEWLTRIFTDPGDLVVDPFCGSGGIAVGVQQARRRIIVGDIDKEYANMTARRLTSTPA
jgi:site-specific DNA-methyltransferase (adenine-specific)